MESYTSFARVYDTFMDNVPYEEWTAFIIETLKKYGIQEGIVVDLGCGTGSITRLLSNQGYDMIGVDLSEEMLEIAMERQMEFQKEQLESDDTPGILYLQQDMRELELYDKSQAIVSTCDCVNYILEPEELLDTFRRVKECLSDDGIFFFDFNTTHKYRDIIGETTIAEDREECSFIWDNYFYEEEGINEYELTLFIREGSEDLYRKYQETHLQRGYTVGEMKSLLESAGFSIKQMYDDYTKEPATEDSERVCMVAQISL